MNPIKLIANFLINDLKGWLNKGKVSENEFYEYVNNNLFPISEIVGKISGGELSRKDGLTELKAKCSEICAAIKEKRALRDGLRAEKLADQLLQREISLLKLDEYDNERLVVQRAELLDLDKNSKIGEIYNKYFN